MPTLIAATDRLTEQVKGFRQDVRKLRFRFWLQVFVSVLVALTLFWQWRSNEDRLADACRDRAHAWTALHGVIIEQNKVQPASPIVLKAFPEFRKFFTPGTPEYMEAARVANDKRDRALAVLGDMPDC